MFNVGDRVECISGGNKGKCGVVIGPSSPFEGRPRIIVQFDKDDWAVDLWEHRFILEVKYSKEELLIKKIKQMESRQTWQRNQQS